MRERDWGDLDIVSDEEKKTIYKEAMEARQTDGFFWRVLNVEPMSDVCLRVERSLKIVSGECGSKNVIIVSHGETMVAFRVILEGLTPWDYALMESAPGKKGKSGILNCQVLQYTRENPENPKSKKLSPNFTWMRSVCATDPTLSRNIWTKIERKKYSNTELLKIAESTPRMIK